MKKVALKMIKMYQNTGGRKQKCKFFPTCSNYSYQAIEKYGFLKGTLKSSIRILKCNPFSKGGVDLLK